MKNHIEKITIHRVQKTYRADPFMIHHFISSLLEDVSTRR